MKKILLMNLIIMLSIFTGCTQLERNNTIKFSQDKYINVAFVNVNVIPMDTDTIIENQTVVIKEGIIQKIGNNKEIRIPSEALMIDGKGRYLMPGLIDMHAHIFYNEDRYHFPSGKWDKKEHIWYAEDLLLFLANGVTSIRVMRGEPFHLELREKHRKKMVLVPRMYLSSPYINSRVAKTPDEAISFVSTQKLAGYDFIKEHGKLDEKTYRALLSEAKNQDIPVIGHLPPNLDINTILPLGQSSIDHMEEFFKNSGINNIDENSLINIVTLTNEYGITVTPTMVMFDHIIEQIRNIDSVLLTTELDYIPPLIRENWNHENNRYANRFKKEQAQWFEKNLDYQKKLTNALYRSGTKILVGTDSGAPIVIPGFSIHEELQILVESGLTPFQALKAGTKEAAEYLNVLDSIGTVSTGKKADLILLEANPLDKITNSSKRVGVMINGTWFLENELKLLIDDLAKSYMREGEFIKVINKKGVAQAIEFHKNENKINSSNKIIRESTLNEIAYEYLDHEKIEEAIQLFKLNVEIYPNSFNVYDGLGEAFMINKDLKSAILNYQKSLEINPQNSNAVEMLEKIIKH